MTKVTDCPFPVVPREKFIDILGNWNGYYDSDIEWLTANIDACVWFLSRLVEDPSGD